MKIISKESAKEAGLERYFTGVPCSKKHVSERYICGHCVECQRLKNAKRYADNPDEERRKLREWAIKNPEKTKESLRKAAHKWRKLNPEKSASAWKNYFKSNREKCLASDRKAYADNREKHIKKSRNWNVNNSDKVAAREAARRAKIRNATPKWADLSAIQKIYAECARTTESTGVLHHVDHIVPLGGKNVIGLHVHWNLQILPAVENIRKGNKLIDMRMVA